jgi:hypothetical protein
MGMFTQILLGLFSAFSLQAPQDTFQQGIAPGPNVVNIKPLSTHVETWCYASAECTGSPVKDVPLTQCKGEHQGVRLVVVYDVSGKVKKRGPCISGDLLAPF